MTLHIPKPFAGMEEAVQENVPLARFTWYRIGGPARWLVQPRTIEELRQAVLRCRENEIPVYVLGLGANLLVSDDGVDGAVFRLDAEQFRLVRTDDKTLMTVGAGVDMQKLLLRCVRSGLAGIECLAGIPGTIGGGVRMNAGGKFGSIGGVVRQVRVMDIDANIFDRLKDDLIFDYRSTNIAARFILSATIELEEDDPERIMRRTKEIWMFKRNTQPLNTKSCGCVFKNPPGTSAGFLIDRAGLKGLRVGGAEVSHKHANFFVAHPGCRAEDVTKLMKVVSEKVQDLHGVILESELQTWP